MNVDLGLDTFGDIADGPDGAPLHPALVIREVLAEGELADRLGLDFSASASTIAVTSPSPPPSRCSRGWRGAPRGSRSVRR